jgi:hypothetical protein
LGPRRGKHKWEIKLYCSRYRIRNNPNRFGAWKNGSQHYMPEWMKLVPDRHPYMLDKNGRPVDSPSPFATALLEAD